jgi:hypothetical protein
MTLASSEAMRRLGIAWALAASLAALGSLWAHELTYRLVAPSHSAYASLLARTGHGYLDHAPLLIGILLAAVALSLFRACLDGARARRPGPAPGWLFAILPVLGFALQEHLERLLHDGAFPLGAGLEPTFVLGVVLQLPFALAALVVARALLGAARELGQALARLTARSPSWPRPPRAAFPPSLADRPRAVAAALGYGGRGPPSRLV